MRWARWVTVVVTVVWLAILFFQPPGFRIGHLEEPILCTALSDGTPADGGPLSFPPVSHINAVDDYLEESGAISEPGERADRITEKAYAGVVQMCNEARLNRLAAMVFVGFSGVLVLGLLRKPKKRRRKSSPVTGSRSI